MNDQTPAGDALIVFTPSGKRGRFALGTPVLQAARALGVDIDSVCGGRAICGRCQVTPSFGEFAKHGIVSADANLNGVTAVEERYDAKRGLKEDRRLSCQTQILGDLVIDVPEESQVHKQVVRKRADTRDIELNPVTRLYYIEVEEPDMHHPSSDLERVYKALQDQWGVDGITADLVIMQELQTVLRKGEWKITIAIHHRLARARIPVRTLLQIHDELIFELPPETLDEVVALVVEEMAGVQNLVVPLKVDVKSGPNWADAKPWKP